LITASAQGFFRRLGALLVDICDLAEAEMPAQAAGIA